MKLRCDAMEDMWCVVDLGACFALSGVPLGAQFKHAFYPTYRYTLTLCPVYHRPDSPPFYYCIPLLPCTSAAFHHAVVQDPKTAGRYTVHMMM